VFSLVLRINSNSFSKQYLTGLGFLRGVTDSLRTRVYPKVSGPANWSENCKWYSSLPLGAVVLLFREWM
jgi:hypothetical protein